MQAKTIAAVISLVTMVGAAYAAGTSVADNLLRARTKEQVLSAETFKTSQDPAAEWNINPEQKGADNGDALPPATEQDAAAGDMTVDRDPASEREAGRAQDLPMTPEVQVLTAKPAAPAVESPELRSLMSGGSEEEGFFFRSRSGREDEGEDEEEHEKYEDEEEHEYKEKYEKKNREARFRLFEGYRAFEDD